MNTRVNVTKRVKLLGRDGYHPVMLSANGRIRPGWVVVKGREQRHTEGSYYLDWTEGGKRKRISVGKDPAQAYARKLKEAGVSVDAVRYNGTIHDFVALNALRHVPSTEAAIDQINAGLRRHLESVTH